MYPAAGAWGGSSVFVHQFLEALRRCGIRPVFDLTDRVDVIFLIDPRDDLQNKAFGMEEIRHYKNNHKEVRIIHRINECDMRKGSDYMDEFLRQANDIADHTVFISEWLQDYFISRWYDPDLSHQVIYNGADPAVFHPLGAD
jgi:glycosyltransferase involved in cell wall biosynthesis